ncbi:MAG: c-type cytochrome [Parvibaculales bacterium]
MRHFAIFCCVILLGIALSFVWPFASANSVLGAGLNSSGDAPIVADRVVRFKKSGSDIQDIFKKYLAAGDAPAIAQAAARMAQWGNAIPDYFPSGATSAGARDEIWQNFSDFKSKAQKYAAAASQLHKIAQSGDMKRIAAQARVVGGTCKACHDVYRIKK